MPHPTNFGSSVLFWVIFFIISCVIVQGLIALATYWWANRKKLTCAVFGHTGATGTQYIEGRVLENTSVITASGIEYRAKIAVQEMGGEKWVWVTIPERDAKVLPLGSWLIVDLSKNSRPE